MNWISTQIDRWLTMRRLGRAIRACQDIINSSRYVEFDSVRRVMEAENLLRAARHKVRNQT